ncbi:MAG: peptidoglycan DD-metalloendopeptidase family protein [Proteobacteria bacterium]|nr:peptidoglycan DD-metalloendopeptidase family protein [Pseudomonadota bacterium]
MNPTRGRLGMQLDRCGRLRQINARRGAGILLAVTLLVAAPVRSADRAELEALHSRIETLKKNLAGAEENRVEASDGLRASERGVSEANRVLHNIVLQQNSVKADLIRVGEQTRAMEAGIAAQQGQLGRLLAMRYTSGQQDYLKLLLSGRDPNQTARDLHYYGYISRAQADFIRALRNNLAGLAQLGRDARDKSTELAELATKQREARKELLAQQAERRKVLARLSTQVRSQHREIKSLQRDEARLSRLVEELAKLIAPGAPGRRNEKLPESSREAGVFAALKGKLRLPTRGELINRFGTPRSDSGLSWKGLFIRSASGQDVRAVATGQVVFAEWMRGFGNLLIIDHGQGYLTIYGNNEALLKQAGDTVRAGDSVATVGNSGGNPDSGLYFEIRHQGKAFDPLRWVSLK